MKYNCKYFHVISNFKDITQTALHICNNCKHVILFCSLSDIYEVLKCFFSTVLLHLTFKYVWMTSFHYDSIYPLKIPEYYSLLHCKKWKKSKNHKLPKIKDNKRVERDKTFLAELFPITMNMSHWYHFIQITNGYR